MKRTCLVHRSDRMQNTLSFAGAYLMKDALGITDPEAWVRYAAQYATFHRCLLSWPCLLLLGPRSHQRSCYTCNLRCLQRLQSECIGPSGSTSRKRSRCSLQGSVQDHTRPLHLKLTSFCPGTTTVGALGCPVQYLVALLSPAFQPDTACLLSALRALRISHVWEDTLCVWRPKIDVLQSLSAPLRAQESPGLTHPSS